MKPLITALIVGLGALIARPALAAGDPAQIARGQKTFQYWCATCHGATPGENGRPLPGTASLMVKYKGAKTPVLEERDDLPPVLVLQVIRHGSEGMPFFRKTEISASQADDIAAYLARNTK
jgi:mono/diheme cytochrome c family protein